MLFEQIVLGFGGVCFSLGNKGYSKLRTAPSSSLSSPLRSFSCQASEHLLCPRCQAPFPLSFPHGHAGGDVCKVGFLSSVCFYTLHVLDFDTF